MKATKRYRKVQMTITTAEKWVFGELFCWLSLFDYDIDAEENEGAYKITIANASESELDGLCEEFRASNSYEIGHVFGLYKFNRNF